MSGAGSTPFALVSDLTLHRAEVASELEEHKGRTARIFNAREDTIRDHEERIHRLEEDGARHLAAAQKTARESQAAMGESEAVLSRLAELQGTIGTLSQQAAASGAIQLEAEAKRDGARAERLQAEEQQRQGARREAALNRAFQIGGPLVAALFYALLQMLTGAPPLPNPAGAAVGPPTHQAP